MMQLKKITRALAVVGLLATVSSALADYSFREYRVPLAGYDSTLALGISTDGIVWGSASSPTRFFDPFIDRRGRAELLTFMNGFSPIDIALGEAFAGNVSDSFPPFTTPYLQLPNGRQVKITVPNSIEPRASGLNNLGSVVGSYKDASNNSHGFIFSLGRVNAYNYPGAMSTILTDVNDLGVAVGYAVRADYTVVPFKTDGHRAQVIATGLAPYDQFSPCYVNDLGTITGATYRYTPTGYVSDAAVLRRGRLETLNDPKVWPATITISRFGFPETLTFVGKQFTVSGLNDLDLITAYSFATYIDDYGFQTSFTASYIGTPRP